MGEAAVHVTAENIQVHGAVGFTWDSDAQLLYKRAKQNDVLWGASGWQRQRVAAPSRGRVTTSHRCPMHPSEDTSHHRSGPRPRARPAPPELAPVGRSGCRSSTTARRTTWPSSGSASATCPSASR